MSVGIRMKLNEGFYLRNPQDTEIGRSIIKYSIRLIHEIGLEAFTFKKLAAEINSTEATIYRYFENKHNLLFYLVSWYWEWINNLIYVNTQNISDPIQKLKIVIHSFIVARMDNPDIDYVNESILQKVVIEEGPKVFFTKDIDKENSKGFFANYVHLIDTVSQVILEIAPDFLYPHALATNLYDMANNNAYFAEHLPGLTDIPNSVNTQEELESMLEKFCAKLLDF